MSSSDLTQLLAELGIDPVNSGAYDGTWLDTKGEVLDSVDPATGKVIAAVRQAQKADYERIAQTTVRAFHEWRTWPAPKRGEVVRALGNALREKKDALGRLVTLEMGKILSEGLGEVQEMIDMADLAVGMSRQLYGKTMHSERSQHRMYEQWHPLGTVGIITAFNFPVAVWAWNAAIAAVCGDPVIWKPAAPAPLCGVAVQRIANRVMADHGLTGVFGLVVGPGSSVGERMLNDARLPLISFTGSTQVGRRVAGQVAQRFGRTILELGGNNAILVTEDANLDLAVRAIVFGAVGTAGQRCTSTRRIIAHSSIAGALSERLADAYAQVRIGDPLDPDTLMGPLVTPEAVEDMFKALDEARAQGGEIVTGGKRRPDIGPQFVEPTIVRMRAQSPIVKQETFAPILYLLEYDDFEQALDLHNDVPQGLSSAVFTESMRRAEEFVSARGSDCGIANVNIGTSGAEIGGAFGGEKETGGGRESGSDAWKAYMRRQTNTLNWSMDLPLAQGIRFGD
jgi:aldehyde dehydrogenase (NAD+)